MARNKFFNLRLNKAQVMIEFSLVLIVAIFAFIAMQAMVKRTVQGNLRNSADNIGDQFSPRWTNISKINVVHSSIYENTTLGNLTRTTSRGMLSIEESETSPIKDESPELRI